MAGSPPYADASGPNEPYDGSMPTDDDGGESCSATRADIEGPFFKPSSPERTNLVEPGTSGIRITLRGTIMDADCRPIAGAIVDFWQADVEGAYDNEETFHLRGHQVVAEDGRYELTTIVPGRYLNGSQYRPAHVHCKVYVRGTERLTTQLYFKDDPFNAVDPWFSEQTMLRPRDDGGALLADFDFSVT
jgi:protocatechuate 3,4-dioxygenase beta subunit